MTDKNSDLKKRIVKWLDEQGYPLEMAVARAFRRAGFRTIQSEYYKDSETGKPREIDVSAFIDSYAGDAGNVLMRIHFCVECKLAKDKPWVMFTSADLVLSDIARVVQRAASDLGHDLLRTICRREDIQNLPAFLLPERPGYGLAQAFAGGQDVPYSAIMGAAKAAIAEVKESNSYSPDFPICEISFPVVVVDGKLFECFLGHAGKVIIEEIKAGTILWRSPIVGMPHTIVQVVTLPAVDDFLKGAKETSFALFACQREMKNLLKKNAP